MPDGGANPENLTTTPEPLSEAPGVEAARPNESRTVPQTLQMRGTTLFAPRQLRKFRLHEEDFVHALSARLSSFLRTEIVIHLEAIEMVPFQRLTASWPGPCHLGLFKTEPLRGVSILHLPLPLGLCLVDRMMGGPGNAPENVEAEMSEIEKALLEQLTQIVLEEWCANWAAIKELKPVSLGSETSGDFLQTAAPQTNILTLALRVKMGELEDQILLGIPYPALEPLIRQLTGESETSVTIPPPQSAAGSLKWNHSLDDVQIKLTAEWHGLEISARDILHLKEGDVLPMDPDRAANVVVRVEELPKFSGRLGAVAGKWAVELTQPIKS